jgi:beta-glucosidase/6-phospho-beta-glucosidase/beta-galactosidase
MKYFFVSYNYGENGNTGVGSCYISHTYSFFDLIGSQNGVAEKFGFDWVVINNYKEISKKEFDFYSESKGD